MLRFVIFLAGVMAVSTGSAEGVSPCPVDSIPIQIVSGDLNTTVTTLSDIVIPESPNPPMDKYLPPNFLKEFVVAVTEHATARLGGDKLCLDSVDSKKRSLLQFVVLPFALNNPLNLPQPLNVSPSNGCRISSPWIDLAIERKPIPWIRATVRWNFRQFLIDQAVLAEAKNVPPGVAQPLSTAEFSSAVQNFRKYGDHDYPSSLPEPAVKLAEERMPPDLLWAFRTAQQNKHPPIDFFIYRPMYTAVGKSAEGYTKLVLALIDRCLASDGGNLHYNNIVDTADLISLEKYKIDMPISY